MRSGGWTEVDPSWMLGTEVTGKTVGVVGFGRIGQAFARRARGFDLRVLYASPRDAGVTWAERVSLDELLTQSDFVSLHVPLTSASQDLLSRDRIALLKGAIVVNTARGGVLDDVALAEALAEGRVGAAGSDVFPDEPRVPRLTSDSRTSSSRRTSGRARETRAAMARLALEDAARVGRGEPPLHPVS